MVQDFFDTASLSVPDIFLPSSLFFGYHFAVLEVIFVNYADFFSCKLSSYIHKWSM